MKIAIIGSGNVGKALAGSAVKAGHLVTIASAHADKAEAAAKATGARSAARPVQAVKDAEVVILAIPSSAVDDVLSELGGALAGKAVVDPTNRVNPQDPGSVLDGNSNAERIQAKVPGAHVVKAFNSMFATRMASPEVGGQKVDAYAAGDDKEAKKKVLELAASIGLRPIDAGPLAMARVLEGMGLLNILLQIQNGWPWQSAWKQIGPTGEEA